jgi:hypothetical protein
VIELERHRRSGDRQKFISFHTEVVRPARLHCLGLFQQWWQMRRETGEETATACPASNYMGERWAGTHEQHAKRDPASCGS